MARPYSPVRRLHVDIVLEGGLLPVGELAWRDRRVYFAYAPDWIARGIELSPFRLPLGPHVTQGDPGLFEGLPGVFADSLPDGWGRLLIDRKLRNLGIQPGSLTALDRLALVGRHGMGALCYRPAHDVVAPQDEPVDLDRLFEDSRLVLDDDAAVVVDRLLAANGSSAGARPKALVGHAEGSGRLVFGKDALPEGFSHWIVKFPAREDPPDIGPLEHAYAAMARTAGIDIPETTLLPRRRGPPCFAVQRFDRDGERRIHMATVCALLHADHRLPSIGYVELLKATRLLTRNQGAVEQMFRRMVFNVLAHNRDDHTKNHAFLMDAAGIWGSSPAYDLTFSSGPAGEHALDIAGEGRNPGLPDLMSVADAVGVPKATAKDIVDQVRSAIHRWPEVADASGVSSESRRMVAGTILR